MPSSVFAERNDDRRYGREMTEGIIAMKREAKDVRKMRKQMQTARHTVGRSRLVTAALGLLVFLSPLGVSEAVDILGFRYGRLERSQEVTRAFESLQIDRRYTYYYSGLGDIPYAVIGIDPAYTLRRGLWSPIDLTPQKLRNWLRQMDAIYDGYRPAGSRILDDTGKPIGVWYSSKRWTTVVIEENKTVAVFAPEPPGFRIR